MKELKIEEMKLVGGGDGWEFGRDYIDVTQVTGGTVAAAGGISATLVKGSPEKITARAGLSALRAGAVAIPVIAYNATVWVNNNTSLQSGLANIIDKATGLDKVGNDQSGNGYTDGTAYC